MKFVRISGVYRKLFQISRPNTEENANAHSRAYEQFSFKLKYRDIRKQIVR